MVAFCVILAVLVVIGALVFRAHVTDSLEVSPGVGWGGALLLFVLGGVMFVLLLKGFKGSPLTLVLIVIGLCGLMAALYAPFLANLLGTSVTDFIYPTGGGEVKSYDIAEKLTVEERYTEAIAEYERVIGEDPEDVVPRVRLADVHCRTKRYDLAVQALNEALELDLPPERWFHIANRLADVLAQDMYEPQKAAAVLSKIARKYPQTEFARYALERIARLQV
jgi:tetratricopeptide (TPR) repeat protein